MPQASMPASDHLASRYQHIRQHSLDLIRPLSVEDCNLQSMPDASPAKWHLAHTSWFFETLILQPHQAGYRPFDEHYGLLFNSYYNSLGPQHERPQRGLLSRPGLAEVLQYRQHVDAAMTQLLAAPTTGLAELIELGLNHEQQHQELLLTDVQHAFSCHPFQPSYHTGEPPRAAPQPDGWLSFEADLYQIGHAGDGFCFDNETPAHRVFLHRYAIRQGLVSNRDYLAYIEAGGYASPAHWLADGWDWRQARAIEAPLYWQRQEDGWSRFGLYGRQPLDPDAPACHLSYYEADAYARFVGARLPGEAEWELGARSAQTTDGGWFGQVWQWTASPYQAYPGFRPPPGPLGEYNAKFMCNQWVLRGSSDLTPTDHSRPSYRNFFHPHCRWQLSGLRLARDA